jgi:endonuclease III
MKEEARIREILGRLEKEYQGLKLILNFRGPLQLLMATILSAQCTDERVNAVTPGLFKKYPTAESFAKADLAELEEDIRPTGFYHNKARAIIGCSKQIAESFGGKVPDRLEDLVKLPGVGRKTANVVLANAFGQQTIAVDTHVFRVSRRLGLAFASDPDKVEQELCAIIPHQKWSEATLALTWHGRKTCTARKPACLACVVYDYCPWEGKPKKEKASAGK